jgi:cell division septum initiation protein DivIVA
VDLGDECRDGYRSCVLDRPEVIEPISAAPVERFVERLPTIRDSSSVQGAFDEPSRRCGLQGDQRQDVTELFWVLVQITVTARQDAEESSARAKDEADEVVANAKAAAAEILARSNAEAEATVAQARKKAAEHLQRAQEEVAALREEAEARMRELHADTETIQRERSQLLDDIREITTRVEEVATAADARFPRPEAPDEAEEANKPSGTAAKAAATEHTAKDKADR